MGAPEEYDWGLRPEQIDGLKADMAISVSVSLDRETAIALHARELEARGQE